MGGVNPGPDGWCGARRPMMRRLTDLIIVAVFAAGMAWVLLAPGAIR